MRDATEVLSRFSKRLQTKKLTLIEIHNEKSRYVSQLKDITDIPSDPNVVTPETHYNKVWPKLWQQVTAAKNPPTDQELDSFHNNHVKKYMGILWRDIDIRFGCSGLVAAVQIFDPRNPRLPQPDSPRLANYGDDDLRVILDFYGKQCSQSVTDSKTNAVIKQGHTREAIVNADKCIAQWIDFRRMLSEGVRDGKFVDVTSFLRHFFSNKMDDLYPDLSDLLIISAVMPVGSCSVERCFSAMKRIKTRLRNRLADQNLEWLLISSMEGADWAQQDSDEEVAKVELQKRRKKAPISDANACVAHFPSSSEMGDDKVLVSSQAVAGLGSTDHGFGKRPQRLPWSRPRRLAGSELRRLGPSLGLGLGPRPSLGLGLGQPAQT
eukprot:gene17468-biopygen8941